MRLHGRHALVRPRAIHWIEFGRRSHDLFRAKESGTRIGIMKHGHLVATLGTADLGHADLERLYLEHMRDSSRPRPSNAYMMLTPEVRSTRICVPFVALAVLAAARPFAQQQPVFRAGVEVVEVFVTVTDHDGQSVKGLGPDDFEIVVDGKLQATTVFSAPPHPVTLTLLLDRTGSVVRMSRQIADAATAFIDVLGPGDKVALSSFTWDCLPPTTDHARLTRVIHHGMPGDIASALWEGIDRVFFSMSAESGRKAILVLSDGQNSNVPLVRPNSAFRAGVDADSPCRQPLFETGAIADEVAQRAEQNGVMIYAVGVENAGGGRDSQLRALARQTGGELFRMQPGQTLDTVFARVASELHSQYLLGFEPIARDGKSRKIDVRVRRPGLTVRARQSYALGGTSIPMANPQVKKTFPISEDDILRALEQGHNGEAVEAVCRVFIPEINSSYTVRAEGPIGRIMRESREAKKRGVRLGRANLTPYHTSSTVHVTAEGDETDALVPPELDEKLNRRPITPRRSFAVFPTRVKVRGVNSAPRILARVDPRSVGYLTFPDETVLNQAEFDAIAGPVEVIVIAGPAEGRCRLPASAVERIR